MMVFIKCTLGTVVLLVLLLSLNRQQTFHYQKKNFLGETRAAHWPVFSRQLG